MEAKAVGRYLRVTPRKARYILDTVCGKSANEALGVLKFIPNEAAKYIRQVVESAIANAEHNYAMDRDILRITRAYVDQGPSLKRIQPRAMGRAYRILHRTSHITVVLTEDETLRKAAVKPKARAAGRRREEAAEPAAVEREETPGRKAPARKERKPKRKAVSEAKSEEEAAVEAPAADEAAPSQAEGQEEG